MSPPNPRPPVNPRGERRALKPPRPGSSAWYVLGFLVLLDSTQAYFLDPSGRPIPYSEFKALLKAGKMAEVTVGEQAIRGSLKTSGGETAPANLFTTTRIDDPNLLEELERAGVKYSGEVVTRWLPELLGWILPLVFFLAILGFFFRRIGGAESGIMSFARSRAKIYADDDVKVSFADVAGVDEAEEELREIVDLLADRPEQRDNFGRWPCAVGGSRCVG
jgi:cell division protease FtsH